MKWIEGAPADERRNNYRFVQFSLFDDLLFLSEGMIAYHGPAEAALDYFRLLGHPCPENHNPADHFIKILHEDRSLPESWARYPHKPDLLPTVAAGAGTIVEVADDDVYAASFLVQLQVAARSLYPRILFFCFLCLNL